MAAWKPWMRSRVSGWRSSGAAHRLELERTCGGGVVGVGEARGVGGDKGGVNSLLRRSGDGTCLLSSHTAASCGAWPTHPDRRLCPPSRCCTHSQTDARHPPQMQQRRSATVTPGTHHHDGVDLQDDVRHQRHERQRVEHRGRQHRGQPAACRWQGAQREERQGAAASALAGRSGGWSCSTARCTACGGWRRRSATESRHPGWPRDAWGSPHTRRSRSLATPRAPGCASSSSTRWMPAGGRRARAGARCRPSHKRLNPHILQGPAAGPGRIGQVPHSPSGALAGAHPWLSAAAGRRRRRGGRR